MYLKRYKGKRTKETHPFSPKVKGVTQRQLVKEKRFDLLPAAFCLRCGRYCRATDGPECPRSRKSLKKSKGYHNQARLEHRQIQYECRI